MPKLLLSRDLKMLQISIWNVANIKETGVGREPGVSADLNLYTELSQMQYISPNAAYSKSPPYKARPKLH